MRYSATFLFVNIDGMTDKLKSGAMKLFRLSLGFNTFYTTDQRSGIGIGEPLLVELSRIKAKCFIGAFSASDRERIQSEPCPSMVGSATALGIHFEHNVNRSRARDFEYFVINRCVGILDVDPLESLQSVVTMLRDQLKDQRFSQQVY